MTQHPDPTVAPERSIPVTSEAEGADQECVAAGPPAWPISLGHCELFRDLPSDRLADLERLCRCQHYAKGEVIVQAGSDDAHSVFVMLQGLARVYREAAQGRKTMLGEIGAGMYFGEFAAIDGHSGSATIKANTDTIVAVIPREIFRLLLRDEPSVAFRVMERLVRLVRSLDERVAGLHGCHEEFDRLHRDLFLVNL